VCAGITRQGAEWDITGYGGDDHLVPWTRPLGSCLIICSFTSMAHSGYHQVPSGNFIMARQGFMTNICRPPRMRLAQTGAGNYFFGNLGQDCTEAFHGTTVVDQRYHGVAHREDELFCTAFSAHGAPATGGAATAGSDGPLGVASRGDWRRDS
jgi:hypothetical protein